MNLTYQIFAAVSLDLLLGDPAWLPHPVRAIGRFAQYLENPMRRLIPNARVAGVVTMLLVVGGTGLVAWSAISIATLLHPVAGDVVSVILLYTSIAARDLAKHSLAVYCALTADDLRLARSKVSEIVGRDTAELDKPGVVRAAVECVAESTVDGVAAPLFFAFIGGPVGAMVYRAINTLDSTFGYMTERYQLFGWASARIDDLANYLPARITAPLIGLAAGLLRLNPIRSWMILQRDGRKHASPNSGLPEAAMAGALGIQLGGTTYYDGEPLEKPTIGEAIKPLSERNILEANALMFVTLVLFLALGFLVRKGIGF